MSGLKTLRNRVRSIKSTQKITRAMQMVAASKLRKVRETSDNVAIYARSMATLTHRVAAASRNSSYMPKLLSGSSDEAKYLLLVLTSDKGLCGGFNVSIIREVKRDIEILQKQNLAIEILCIGRKGYEILKHTYPTLNIQKLDFVLKDKIQYGDIKNIKISIIDKFNDNQFDICKIYYNKFKNAISQTPQSMQLIPILIDHSKLAYDQSVEFIFEPAEELLLAQLVEDNLSMQIYSAILENITSEHGARMTAMDNATRSAKDMIDHLTLKLNRTRQAIITKELTEIISGAEAL